MKIRIDIAEFERRRIEYEKLRQFYMSEEGKQK